VLVDFQFLGRDVEAWRKKKARKPCGAAEATVAQLRGGVEWRGWRGAGAQGRSPVKALKTWGVGDGRSRARPGRVLQKESCGGAVGRRQA